MRRKAKVNYIAMSQQSKSSSSISSSSSPHHHHHIYNDHHEHHLQVEYPTTLPIFRPWLDEKNLWHEDPSGDGMIPFQDPSRDGVLSFEDQSGDGTIPLAKMVPLGWRKRKYTNDGKLVLPFDHFRGMCPQKRTKKTWNKSSQYRNCKTDHLESENILATPRILTKIFGKSWYSVWTQWLVGPSIKENQVLRNILAAMLTKQQNRKTWKTCDVWLGSRRKCHPKRLPLWILDC